jgi:hypothetical protein
MHRLVTQDRKVRGRGLCGWQDESSQVTIKRAKGTNELFTILLLYCTLHLFFAIHINLKSKSMILKSDNKTFSRTHDLKKYYYKNSINIK